MIPLLLKMHPSWFLVFKVAIATTILISEGPDLTAKHFANNPIADIYETCFQLQPETFTHLLSEYNLQASKESVFSHAMAISFVLEGSMGNVGNGPIDEENEAKSKIIDEILADAISKNKVVDFSKYDSGSVEDVTILTKKYSNLYTSVPQAASLISVAGASPYLMVPSVNSLEALMLKFKNIPYQNISRRFLRRSLRLATRMDEIISLFPDFSNSNYCDTYGLCDDLRSTGIPEIERIGWLKPLSKENIHLVMKSPNPLAVNSVEAFLADVGISGVFNTLALIRQHFWEIFENASVEMIKLILPKIKMSFPNPAKWQHFLGELKNNLPDIAKGNRDSLVLSHFLNFYYDEVGKLYSQHPEADLSLSESDYIKIFQNYIIHVTFWKRSKRELDNRLKLLQSCKIFKDLYLYERVHTLRLFFDGFSSSDPIVSALYSGRFGIVQSLLRFIEAMVEDISMNATVTVESGRTLENIKHMPNSLSKLFAFHYPLLKTCIHQFYF